MSTVLRDISRRAPTAVAQRREDVRVDVRLAVLVSVAGRAGAIPLQTVQISGGGLLLAGAEVLRIGQRLRFALDPNCRERGARTDPPIVGAATVVRIAKRGRGAGHRAIRLDQTEELQRRRLVRLVFELQRLDRRRRLERD